MRALPEQKGKVHCVAFSPDGRWLAAGGTSRAVRAWDTASWKCRQAIGHPFGEVTGLAHQPGGDLLAISGTRPKGQRQRPPNRLTTPWDQTVVLWSLGSEQAQRVLSWPRSGGLVVLDVG
ncbi:MAG TPA: hypothetical protein VKE74_27830 [Gemmataceae bacterium]|nr:hypothetical protein [Gemmataceae bacterium]